MSTQEAAFRLVVGLAGDGFESKCSRELCRAELACWYVASRQQTKSIFKVLYSGFGVRAARENVCERHSAKGTTLNSENEMTKPLLVPKIHCPTVRYNCQQECTTLFFLPFYQCQFHSNLGFLQDSCKPFEIHAQVPPHQSFPFLSYSVRSPELWSSDDTTAVCKNIARFGDKMKHVDWLIN